MLRHTITIIIASILILAGTTVLADDYRTPDSLTAEERQLMAANSTDYQHCLHSEVEKAPAEVNDPRAIADLAMHSCNRVLEDMDAELQQRGFDQQFRSRYQRMTMQRVSRDLLQHAMFISAQRSSD